VSSVALFNVTGRFCATQAKCTYGQGLLSEGKLEGSTVTYPHYGAQFNVCTCAVLRGPAKDPLMTYCVIVAGEIGREEPDYSETQMTRFNASVPSTISW
jgi:nitrite reductase/ring-hydroxylating ferredoxin subunit